MRCTHYECRCARAHELAVMADRTGNGRLLREAIDVHDQEVECRLQSDPWAGSPERIDGDRAILAQRITKAQG